MIPRSNPHPASPEGEGHSLILDGLPHCRRVRRLAGHEYFAGGQGPDGGAGDLPARRVEALSRAHSTLAEPTGVRQSYAGLRLLHFFIRGAKVGCDLPAGMVGHGRAQRQGGAVEGVRLTGWMVAVIRLSASCQAGRRRDRPRSAPAPAGHARAS